VQYSDDDIMNAVAFLNGEFLRLWEQGHKTETTIKFRDAAIIIESLLVKVDNLWQLNNIYRQASHEVKILKAQLATERQLLHRLRAVMLDHDAGSPEEVNRVI
jgi:hypothetical protein